MCVQHHPQHLIHIKRPKSNSKMTDINPGVDVSILNKANETQDTYITNPNMKTADAYIQSLQETTMTLTDSIVMPSGPEFRELMREELKANPGAD